MGVPTTSWLGRGPSEGRRDLRGRSGLAWKVAFARAPSWLMGLRCLGEGSRAGEQPRGIAYRCQGTVPFIDVQPCRVQCLESCMCGGAHRGERVSVYLRCVSLYNACWAK